MFACALVALQRLGWRSFLVCAWTAASLTFLEANPFLDASLAWADGETYLLHGKHPAGDLQQVRAELEVGGKLKVIDQKKEHVLKMSVMAEFSYHERWQQGNPQQLSGLRSVRYYQPTKATLKVEDKQEEPQLREDRRLIAIDSGPDQRPNLYSPSGPLTRDELDLLDIPGNSLLLYTVLPAEAVPLRAKWKAPAECWAAILGLDVVGHTDVESTLAKIDNETALIESQGSLIGAIGGVSTEIELRANCLFELKTGKISHFGLAFHEKRAIGPISPGLDVVSRLRVTLTPLTESADLSPEKLKNVPVEPNPVVLLLSYQHPGAYKFHYDRDWYVFKETPTALILRRLEAGEFLAQCNVTSGVAPAKDDQVNLQTFQDQVRKALGKNFQAFKEVEQVPTTTSRRIYRLAADGMTDMVPVHWIYFLVLDDTERRVVFTLTTEPRHLPRIGESDYQMATSLEFLPVTPPPSTPAPATPQTANKTK